jgi:hypothetical protein
MRKLHWGILPALCALALLGCDDGDSAGSGGSGGGDTSDMAVTGGTGGGGGEACTGGDRSCGGECVDVQSDARHCGGCGNVCEAGQRCVTGNCRAPIEEACNGQDDNLDGRIDEGPDGNDLVFPCENLCGAGTRTCANGQLGACTAPAPQDEACDGADNDCDGKVDEGVTTQFYRDGDGDTFGDPSPANGVTACTPPEGTDYVANADDCNDADGASNPDADESCADEADNDCDGDINNGCACAPIGDTRPCGADEGACHAGTQTCGEEGWSECGGDEYVASVVEACTGSDDDCDGITDEGLADDQWENNDVCSMARQLPNAEEGAEEPVLLDDAALYHGAADAEADVDWFRISADERLGLCLPGSRECGFTMVVDFTLPEHALRNDYEMCVHHVVGDSCEDIVDTTCMNVDDDEGWDLETGTYSMALVWDGRCGLDSDRDFIVEVRSPQGINACAPYTLAFSFSDTDAECQPDE